MSSSLATTDLSTASVGTTGTIDLSSAGPTADLSRYEKPASVILFNESGCGLQLTFLPSGNGYALPAGAWRPYKLTPGDSQIRYQVIYLIPSAQISVLMGEYFQPWEEVTPLGILGNSPMGVSGVINTSTASAGTQTIQEKVKAGVLVSGQALGFAHGLGVTPDFAIVIQNATGGKRTSVTNYTSSTVDVYVAGGGSTSFLLYVIKIN